MTSFQRLSSTRDIRAVFARGAAAGGRMMTVHACRRATEGPGRATVVVGRGVGGAVQRNRAKRRLRAALSRVDAPAGLDVVVVGRRPVLRADFVELEGELHDLLTRAGRKTEARGAPATVAG